MGHLSFRRLVFGNPRTPEEPATYSVVRQRAVRNRTRVHPSVRGSWQAPGRQTNRRADSVPPWASLSAGRRQFRDQICLRYTTKPDRSATLSYSLIAVTLVSWVCQYTRPAPAARARS